LRRALANTIILPLRDCEVPSTDMSTKYAWIFFRYARWLLWLAALGYAIEFLLHRADHLNSFGNLLLTTEFWMFFLPLAAILAGCLELMMRDRAGIVTSQTAKVGFDR
jgi:hypothetical protein